MTRARETLALMQLDDAGRPDPRDRALAARQGERAGTLLRSLAGAPSVVQRPAPRPDIADPRLDERVMECTLGDVFVSFAGRKAPGSRTHRAIAALSPGDPLSLVPTNGQWKMVDGEGTQVGRMARTWSVPAGMTVTKAVVGGIFTRRANDGRDQEWKPRLRCDAWDVVVPQLTLIPLPPTGRQE